MKPSIREEINAETAVPIETTPLINRVEIDLNRDNDVQKLQVGALGSWLIRHFWPMAYSIVIIYFLSFCSSHQSSSLSPGPSLNIQSACREGEIWLIRHGEKNTSDRTNVTALYDLSTNGWQRAFYLKSLVDHGLWPKFSAVFATAYASESEIADAFPELVRTKLGQSMVRREYQTVAPLAEQTLGISVNTSFTKDDFSGVALAAAQASLATCDVPVLISWDHCSLPALLRSGFGCNQIECSRCWPDHHYDEVMKLKARIIVKDRDKFILKSRIISMTKEHWQASDKSSFDAFGNDREWVPSLDVLQDSIDIRQATSCRPSYCSERKVARIFGRCVCSDKNSGDWTVQ